VALTALKKGRKELKLTGHHLTGWNTRFCLTANSDSLPSILITGSPSSIFVVSCALIMTVSVYQTNKTKYGLIKKDENEIKLLKLPPRCFPITSRTVFRASNRRGRAVASMRQTEALASVIFFVFSIIFLRLTPLTPRKRI